MPNIDVTWVQLDGSVISKAFSFFETDANVQAAFAIRTDALLNGGILFEREGHQLDAHAANWYASVWSQWCRDVVRSIWCIGFCPVRWVEDPVYYRRPVVVNLELCDIFYRVDVDNQTEFVYMPKNRVDGNDLLQLSGVSPENALQHIITIAPDPPSPNGELRSIMALLAQDLAYELHLQQCDIAANLARANPVVVSEKQQLPFDPEKLTAPTVPGYASQSSNGGTDMNAQTTLERRQYVALQVASAFANGDWSDLDTFRRQMTEARINNASAEQMYLADGRKYVNTHMAESPGDMVIQFRNARMERVFTLLGVPPAMITARTALGTQSGAAHASMMIFENAQRHLQHFLLNHMKQLYSAMFSEHHTVQSAVNDLKNKKVLNKHRVQTQADVTITMPSLPSQELLEILYMNGTLKYEAYCHYMGATHSIPEEYFNKTSQLKQIQQYLHPTANKAPGK